MCSWGSSSLVILRDWRRLGGPLRQVALDACIADRVGALNRVGVRTLNCCCGHGRLQSSVLVAGGIDGTDVIEVLLEDGDSVSVRAHETSRYARV